VPYSEVSPLGAILESPLVYQVVRSLPVSEYVLSFYLREGSTTKKRGAGKFAQKDESMLKGHLVNSITKKYRYGDLEIYGTNKNDG
jgi:hypothetical protein